MLWTQEQSPQWGMLFHTFQIPKQYSVVLSLGWFKGMFTGPPHVVMGKNHVFPIDFLIATPQVLLLASEGRAAELSAGNPWRPFFQCPGDSTSCSSWGCGHGQMVRAKVCTHPKPDIKIHWKPCVYLCVLICSPESDPEQETWPKRYVKRGQELPSNRGKKHRRQDFSKMHHGIFSVWTSRNRGSWSQIRWENGELELVVGLVQPHWKYRTSLLPFANVRPTGAKRFSRARVAKNCQ